MQAEMGLVKAFLKAIEPCFRQRKSLQNQDHFCDIPESVYGGCSRAETDTVSFALKDVLSQGAMYLRV